MVGKNVFDMDREELMDYLYDYITLRNNKASFESNKTKKLNEINRNKERKIVQLNNNFDAFTKKTLHSKTLKAKSHCATIRGLLSDPPELFRVYWIGVLLIRLLMKNGIGFKTFFSGFWLQLWISLGIAFIIYILRNPLFRIIEFFVEILLTIYTKIAISLDNSFAKSKGINNENIAEVYNYPALYSEINDSYTSLYNSVKAWNADYYFNQCNNIKALEKYIPINVRTIGYLSYIYDQLYIGAADNWKEAVNLLNQQKNHAEIAGYLNSLSQKMEKNNQTLTQINRKLDNAFDNLNREITHSCNQINARIDGLFEGYNYY